ncbi:glycosyltransferase 87 family protein [Micromonospora sp. WMMD1102]|uniref:glycosyltransferase 87 family protein n=1 Tax=Micromonospora sp. WMMD1102 TaxID=3016105 RepID=UPI0024158732|nr:glycosyltransferase 87 family protein [Micromonospora sp. WMMD1102]MDG4786950.1 glycosyltransferase 87 family protein [Micromonospora sp. WMMD1102]
MTSTHLGPAPGGTGEPPPRDRPGPSLPVAPAPARPRLRRAYPTGGLVLLPLLVGAAAAAVHQGTGRFWGDLATYHAGVSAAASGDGGLYQASHRGTDGIALGFTYPPFAALLLRPLASLGMTAVVALWMVASVLALLAAVRVTLRAAGVAAEHRATATLAGGLAALPTFAVSGHLQAGQIGLFLMLLVLVDLTGDPRRRWSGLGVGIAAGIKLTPLVFVVYLLATGRFRAAGTAAVGFAGTVALGFAWRPEDSVRFWTGALLDTSRVTADPRTVLNQSLAGALARLTDSADPGTVWFPVAALVGLLGIAVAAYCARRGEALLGVFACATTGVLVSPVSWHHHWVWCVPALVLLAVRSWRGRSRLGFVAAGLTWLVFVAGTSWVLADLHGWDRHFRGWGLLYGNLWVLVGLAWLGFLPVHLRRAGRRRDPTLARMCDPRRSPWRGGTP